MEKNNDDMKSEKTKRKKSITSYGIILFTRIKNIEEKTDEILYLLSQRRDSIGYAEFLKNALKIEDIPRYIKSMSLEERNRCLEYYEKKDPQSLWNDLWINHKSKSFKNDMDRCCKSFMDNMDKYKDIFIECKDINNENPWGFAAKGRKGFHESEINCALREFQEETSIPSNYIKIQDHINPIYENYIGSDGNKYLTIYYVAYIPFIPEIITKKSTSDIRKNYISEEVSNMKWLNYHSCLNYIDDLKKRILKNLNNKLLFGKRKLPRRRFTEL